MKKRAFKDLTAVQILRLFVAAWDAERRTEHRKKRSARKTTKRKLRRLDPHDWIRTPKKPKSKRASRR